VHYLEDLNCEVTVYRNDEFDIEEIAVYDKILLSPGLEYLKKQVY
jgi:anthranilate synthase component 2